MTRGSILVLGLCSCLAAAGVPAGALTVATDPRVEILAAVHVLASEKDPALTGFFPEGRAYADDIRKRFAPHRSHPAVEAYRRARERGLDLPEAFFLMLELGPLPELSGHLEKSPWGADEKFGGKGGPERFRAALSSFARESRFLEFFEQQRPLYRALEESLREEIRGRDDIGLFEDYTGLKAVVRYSWMVSPLVRGLGTSKVVPGRPYEVYSLIGPRWWEAGEGTRFGLAQERYRLWLDMAHALFDALPDEYPERVRASETLFGPVADRCYGDWGPCLREHVAKGVARRVWRWAADTGLTPPEALPQAAEQDILPYADVIERALKAYEAEKDRIPTLRDFFPRILDAFADLARTRPPPHAGAGRPVSPPSVGRPQGGSDSKKESPPLAFFPASANSPAAAAQRLAVRRYNEGDAEAAGRAFLEAVRLDPTDARAYLNGAMALRVTGQRQQAMELVGKAIGLCSGAEGPLLAEALAVRGSLWVELGRPDLARKDYEGSLRSAPGSWMRRSQLESELKRLKR